MDREIESCILLDSQSSHDISSRDLRPKDFSLLVYERSEYKLSTRLYLPIIIYHFLSSTKEKKKRKEYSHFPNIYIIL